MRTMLILLLVASPACAIDHMMVIIPENFSSPPAEVSVGDPPQTTGVTTRPAVLKSRTVCADGMCWEWDNGAKLNETFVAYTKRTGKLPPEAKPQCSTGYCGTFGKGPTLATGGCSCGCNASTCGCHHSPNAGKPLAEQRVDPGKAVSTNNTYTRRLFRRFR